MNHLRPHHARVIRGAQLRRAAASARNRCLPQLAGPLFTSDKHPWPFADGRWLEPIAQIDLAELSAIGAVELGVGLLQLWMDPVEGHLRIIPVDDVAADAVTPPPIKAIASAENWRFVQREDVVVASDFQRTSYLITGHRPPALSPPDLLETVLDECLRQKLEPRLLAVLGRLGRLVIGRQWQNTEPHYFGNFDGIQYGGMDKPPPLLALATDRRFMWGDIGNAQIFYDLSKNGMERFSFDWSC